MLLVRRLIYGVCAVLSLVFISFKGGNLPYMLFYMMIFNTIGAVSYIIYVFYKIRIYQVIPERRVTKQEFVPYNLKLNNESVISFRDVRLTFTKELSEVTDSDKIGCISLEPGEGMDIHKEVFCRYSGTYFIGVDTIEVMDYFKIFRIRFQMPQKMKVTVKPRVLSPDNIAFLTEEESHNSSLHGENEYILDNEVRKYYPGDNKRHIHWKNSAKRQELMVRTRTAEELMEYVIIMDGNIGKLSFEEKIICCDKLRETVLALANYIHKSGYNTFAVLDDDYEKEILTQRDFNELYEKMIDYRFGQENNISEVIGSLNRNFDENIPFIFVVSNHSGLNSSMIEEMKTYRCVSVINVDLFETTEQIFHMES